VFTDLTPRIPLSLKGEGEEFIEGVSPLSYLHSPFPLPRGIDNRSRTFFFFIFILIIQYLWWDRPFDFDTIRINDYFNFEPPEYSSLLILYRVSLFLKVFILMMSARHLYGILYHVCHLESVCLFGVEYSAQFSGETRVGDKD
jgi:hypothetical protein